MASIRSTALTNAAAEMNGSALRYTVRLVPAVFALACAPEQGAGAQGGAASGTSASAPASPVRPPPPPPALDPRLEAFCALPGESAPAASWPPAFERHKLAPGDHLIATRMTELETPLRCVARTEEQLALLWDQAHGWAPPAETPSLDGGMVVLASMGSQGSTGYGIGIDSVLVRADTAVVFVLQRTPGSNCTEGMLVSTPTDAVRIPHASVVRFHEMRVSAPPCDAAAPDVPGVS